MSSDYRSQYRKTYWFVVQNDNPTSLLALRRTLPLTDPTFYIGELDERRLGACGVCGWKQDNRDPYNWYGCPECWEKDHPQPPKPCPWCNKVQAGDRHTADEHPYWVTRRMVREYWTYNQ